MNKVIKMIYTHIESERNDIEGQKHDIHQIKLQMTIIPLISKINNSD